MFVQYFIYYRDTRNYNIQKKSCHLIRNIKKLMQAQQQHRKLCCSNAFFNSLFRNINSMKNVEHRKNGKLRNSKNIHAQCQSLKMNTHIS